MNLLRAFLLVLLFPLDWQQMCGGVEVDINTDGTTGLLEQFVIVVDFGSSGSRIFVYQVSDGRVFGSRPHKVKPGISKVERSKDALWDHVKPLVTYAQGIVPQSMQKMTPIYLRATAGMRLLSIEEQQSVYDLLYETINTHIDEFPFFFERDHVGTISGTEEGYFGALSVNYLMNRISHDRRISSLDHASNSTPVVGALDLGGSSTQIVFQPASCQDASMDCPSNATIDDGILDTEDMFVKSYLSFGADRVRERVWSHLVSQHPDTTRVVNPCAFPAREDPWEGVTLVGSGDSEHCLRVLDAVLYPSCSSPGLQPCPLAGHPAPPKVRGVSFVAMSVFFFAFDCVRHISGGIRGWPSPTLTDMRYHIRNFCSSNWDDIMNADEHAWTWEEQMPHRCFESTYILSLLSKAYGFDPDEQNIQFALRLDGMEVEWTLGYVLAKV